MLAHRSVTEVFAVAVVTPKQVAREAKAPHGDHRNEQPLASVVAVGGEAHNPGHHHEAQTPHDVDDGCVFQDETQYPRTEHQHNNGER